MTREAANGQALSFDNPLSSGILSQVEAVLPEYLATQRWYRAKARTISRVQIVDVIPFTGNYVLVAAVHYLDGETDSYQLPVVFASVAADSDMVARVRDKHGAEGVLSNALAREDFRAALLDSIVRAADFAGSGGRLRASRSEALRRSPEDPPLTSFVSRAEQSNSSIVYGDGYILKMFRKLEAGINPDLEIGRFLTQRGFKYTPPVLGEIVYEPAGGEAMHAAILQGFVKNRGDAWKFTLDSLTGFFERALQNDSAPVLRTYHPLELAAAELPALARQTIGDYVESARLLGVRTAQLHAALADGTGPDFAPEEVSPDFAEHLYAEMIGQAGSTFELLSGKANQLSGDAAVGAEKLLESQASVRERFTSLRGSAITALRIRHHGDYHLGQVLATGNDFIIIDFEGEPARPLAERRTKALAMRDVAGMVRSFSYAGYAALFGLVPGVAVTESGKARIEGWAAYWGAWVSAEFLKSYIGTAAGAPFLGSDAQEHRVLFDAFMLQKALYEVSYELNNRPGWVQIPLRGILSLIA